MLERMAIVSLATLDGSATSIGECGGGAYQKNNSNGNHIYRGKRYYTYVLSRLHISYGIAPVDYVATSMDFTFGPRISRHCVNVTIVNDNLPEGDEVFYLTINTTDPNVNLNPNEAMVVISDTNSKFCTAVSSHRHYISDYRILNQ